jgi:hypothetical protein
MCGQVLDKISPDKTTDAGDQNFFHEFLFFCYRSLPEFDGEIIQVFYCTWYCIYSIIN